LGRRAFLNRGALFLTAAGVQSSSSFGDVSDSSSVLEIGLVTDLHYADKQPVGSRHYRETPGKLEEAAEQFGKHKLAFLVELGDLIDAADSVDAELGYLHRINRDFAAICPSRHYVLGNHCVSTLKKEEFLDGVEQKRSYYSFDSGNFHFVVLDSCFRSDGQPYGRNNFDWTDPNVPAAEVEWLMADLQSNQRKTIVFAHQRLDVKNQHGVNNASELRKILAESGNVLAVFQGHSHENDYREIDGIHYCTLVAMIEGAGAESNGYSVLTLQRDGGLHLRGFRKQHPYAW